jgi:hypothetical protein
VAPKLPKKGDDPERVRLELEMLTEKITGKLILRSLQAVTSATPVDTGFARGHWTPTVGSPALDRQSPPRSVTLTPGGKVSGGSVDKKAARAEGRAARAANLAKAQALEKTYKVAQGRAFLSNNVPYLRYLNEGSSAQAGAKFVERAVDAAVRSLSGLRL